MRLLSAEESRRLDRLSHEKYGVEFWSLMSRAGEEVARALLDFWPEAATTERPIMVLAGKGNNGGDGFVAARCLKDDGARPRVLLLGRKDALSADAARACGEFVRAGGEVEEILSEEALSAAFTLRPGWVVDAIFGTGLNAAVQGLPSAAIEMTNRSGIKVVAVDIPSGINANTGAVMGKAIRADVTVTFGLPKYGHASYPGTAMVGEIRVVDIGFPRAALDEVAPQGMLIEADDVRPLLVPRAIESHKGIYGHPLILAGSEGKSGAALLASRGALRTGAGLVTAAIPRCVAPIVAAGQAELMTEPMPDADGHFAAAPTIDRLRGLLDRKSAIMVGPGISVSADTKTLMEFLITEASQPDRPLLIDADGLNALSEMGCEHLRKARGPVLLTPHPGEMARLLRIGTAQVNADRITAAHRLCDLVGGYCLLKGARTVLAGPSGVIRVNSSGNPGMASPGMGDALSGILAALLSQGLAPMDALTLGAFIHGAAADRIAARSGAVGFLAGDLIAELPATRAMLANRAR